jgi:hypothetical protein
VYNVNILYACICRRISISLVCLTSSGFSDVLHGVDVVPVVPLGVFNIPVRPSAYIICSGNKYVVYGLLNDIVGISTLKCWMVAW